ncbi:MAG: c-type cytochrome [Bacteroidota bacterium]
MKKVQFALVFLALVIYIGCSSDAPEKTTNKTPEKELVKKEPTKAEPIKEEVKKEPKEEPKETPKAEEKPPAPQEPTVPPEQIAKAKEIIAGVSDKDIAAVDAKKVFRMQCAACHGFTGNLVINGSKDLTKSTIPLEESIAQVYFGKGLMTPFKGKMSETEIVAVSKYIETEFRK